MCAIKYKLGSIFVQIRRWLLNRYWVLKIVLSAYSLLKLFTCLVVFMLSCYGKMRLVERVCIGENLFWKQFQTAFDVLYHICLKDADRNKLRPPSVCSKLKEFSAFSMDCVSCFSSLFFYIFWMSMVYNGIGVSNYTSTLLKKK